MVEIHDIRARVGSEGEGRGVAVELWRGVKKKKKSKEWLLERVQSGMKTKGQLRKHH